MKHDPKATANAMAVTIAIVYIFCRIAVFLFPDFSMTIAQSWLHGLELNKVSGWNLSLESFILGLTTITTGGWLLGYIFATVYNYFGKK